MAAEEDKEESKKSKTNDPVVYWEKQEKDTMTCGLHCLNALLQGPYFDESELSQIALQIDDTEKSLLAVQQKPSHKVLSSSLSSRHG